MCIRDREYRVERDNRVVLAIDSGRTMAEPVGGMPRVDRAVSAALLLAYVGLKLNDRISLFSFAAKPPTCLLYTSPSPRDRTRSRMPSSA